MTPTQLGSSVVRTRPSLRRRLGNRGAQLAVYAAVLLALAPLVSVLWAVVIKGMDRLDVEFLQYSMRNIGAEDVGGGAYHAIVGTLEQVALAALMSVPVGVLVAVYLVWRLNLSSRCSSRFTICSSTSFTRYTRGCRGLISGTLILHPTLRKRTRGSEGTPKNVRRS